MLFSRRYATNIMFEVGLGFAVHNGKLKKVKKKKGRTLGSRLLFRESLSLGLLYNETDSVSLFIDHVSNANLAPPNHGITNLGVRLGFAL